MEQQTDVLHRNIFKFLCLLATMKKRENLYIQYWLNLRQLAEKKTQL
jgi:hypothetical protein